MEGAVAHTLKTLSVLSEAHMEVLKKAGGITPTESLQQFCFRDHDAWLGIEASKVVHYFALIIFQLKHHQYKKTVKFGTALLPNISSFSYVLHVHLETCIQHHPDRLCSKSSSFLANIQPNQLIFLINFHKNILSKSLCPSYSISANINLNISYLKHKIKLR